MHINDILDLPNLQALRQRFRRLHTSGGPDDCWQWLGSFMAGGYGKLSINNITYSAHRLSYVLHVGAIPGEHGRTSRSTVCRHTCDNPACVNPAHLMLGLQLDNIRDALERKRVHVGTKRWGAKLTEVQVREIRTATGDSETVAQQYGVARATVRAIRNGTRWKHLS